MPVIRTPLTFRQCLVLTAVGDCDKKKRTVRARRALTVAVDQKVEVRFPPEADIFFSVV
jgi:hypothetical protein